MAVSGPRAWNYWIIQYDLYPGRWMQYSDVNQYRLMVGMLTQHQNNQKTVDNIPHTT